MRARRARGRRCSSPRRLRRRRRWPSRRAADRDRARAPGAWPGRAAARGPRSRRSTAIRRRAPRRAAGRRAGPSATIFASDGFGGGASVVSVTTTATSATATAAAPASAVGDHARGCSGRDDAAGAAAALLAFRGLDEVAPQLADVVAHPRAPLRRRSEARLRETRWRSAASDVSQLAGELVVGPLLDHVRGDQPALLGRQLGQHRLRRVVTEQPDHLGVRLAERRGAPSRASAASAARPGRGAGSRPGAARRSRTATPPPAGRPA